MAPTKRLAFVSIVYVFMAVFLLADAPLTQAELEAKNAQQPDDPTNSTSGTFGFFDAIGAIVETVFDILEFFWDLLTFNIPGAPFVVRSVLTITVSGSFLWDVATLIRGGGGS